MATALSDDVSGNGAPTDGRSAAQRSQASLAPSPSLPCAATERVRLPSSIVATCCRDDARAVLQERETGQRVQLVWRLMRTQDKASGSKTVLKEKVWLGTYHTAINAAVHHDFYKVVLAVEGCIFTCAEMPTCTPPLGKKKTHKLKLNFALDELPTLMFKAVKFSQLWNRHKQDAERYVFRACEPAQVQTMVEKLIATRCDELRPHIAKNESVRSRRYPPSAVSCPHGVGSVH